MAKITQKLRCRWHMSYLGVALYFHLQLGHLCLRSLPGATQVSSLRVGTTRRLLLACYSPTSGLFIPETASHHTQGSSFQRLTFVFVSMKPQSIWRQLSTSCLRQPLKLWGRTVHAEGARLGCVEDNALLFYSVFIKAIYKQLVIVGPEVHKARWRWGLHRVNSRRDRGKKIISA